jgi:hypothetical protein
MDCPQPCPRPRPPDKSGGTRSVASVPSGASAKCKEFTNSLGMKFVPVTGTDLLFCI